MKASEILQTLSSQGVTAPTVNEGVQMLLRRVIAAETELLELRTLLHRHKTQATEISCLLAGSGSNAAPLPEAVRLLIEDRNLWKEALTDAGVVDWVLSEENKNDPKRLVNDLIVYNIKMSWDPAISADAAQWHALLDRLLPYAQEVSPPDDAVVTLERLLTEVDRSRIRLVTPIQPNWYRYALSRLKALFQ